MSNQRIRNFLFPVLLVSLLFPEAPVSGESFPGGSSEGSFPRGDTLKAGSDAGGVGCIAETGPSVQKGQGYLFAYFTAKNNNRNGLHLAWSTDGYQWTPIGPELPFLVPEPVPPENPLRMRDPFLMQAPDGTWHCLWTTGWETSCIGHATSRDLIHWSKQTYPEVMKGYEARNCWAPEMIWNEGNNEFLIFWASTIMENGVWKTEPGHPYDHRMYCTTTTDFIHFSPARLFFDPGHSVIDATILKNGSHYMMIYKDEREFPAPRKNLLIAKADRADGPYIPVSETPFTGNWVEGPAICVLPDSSYLIFMEAYREHRYLAKQTRDFTHFEEVTERISLPAGAKHGSVVTVTDETIRYLIKALRFFENDRIDRHIDF